MSNPEEALDAVNKQYDSLQTIVSKTFRSEQDCGADEERSEDDEFEDECNIGYLVRGELTIRCAGSYQFCGTSIISPFIGIIFKCKFLYAWLEPRLLKTETYIKKLTYLLT